MNFLTIVCIRFYIHHDEIKINIIISIAPRDVFIDIYPLFLIIYRNWIFIFNSRSMLCIELLNGINFTRKLVERSEN